MRGRRHVRVVSAALAVALLVGCAESNGVDGGPLPSFDAGPARMPDVDSGTDAGPDCVQSRVTSYWSTGAETFLASEGLDGRSRRPLRFRAGYALGGPTQTTDAGVPGTATFSAGSVLYEPVGAAGPVPWAELRGMEEPVFAELGPMIADDGRRIVADVLFATRTGQAGLFGSEIRRLQGGVFTFGQPAQPVREDVVPAVVFRPRNVSSLELFVGGVSSYFVLAYTEDGRVLAENLPDVYDEAGVGLSDLQWCEPEGRARPVVRAAVRLGNTPGRPPGLVASDQEWPGLFEAELWVDVADAEGQPVAHLARLGGTPTGLCVTGERPLRRPTVDGRATEQVVAPRVFVTVPVQISGNTFQDVLVVVEDGPCSGGM